VSINLRNVLALLMLSVVGVGGVSSPAAGQNTFLNITDSDIADLVSNVTESVTETGDSDSSLPFTSDNNNNSIADLVSNVTESVTETGDSDSSLPLVNDSSISSSSVTTTSDTIRINEIELNPTGNDEGKEWIELYNPAEVDINIGNFEIRTSSEPATIKLPSDAVIGAGKTYVLEVNQHMLSNTVESLILTDATGNMKDRTPSLVDRSDDERTWQRIPDGNNEWQFVEDTRGNLNDPDSRSTTYDSAYSGSDVKCLGSAGCAEGIAIRIVDADTLYVAANGAVYKVDLALVKAPARTEEKFIESTAFTRDLCLGSTALVDQDDKLQTSNSSVIAVVYCSSSNLNSELLDNGYAELDIEQCAASEFANEPWVKDHGC
jgi:endonuclease YncB( thermonuclease family)